MSHVASTLRNLGANGLALLRCRLALLGVELQDEAMRWLGLLLCAASGLLCALLGLAFTLAWLVLLWESQRLWLLGFASALFLGIGLLCGLFAWRLAARAPRLFAASLAELEADRAALQAAPAGEAGARSGAI